MLAVVTGTGGLALEVALALARAEATIILAGRNKAKGTEALRAVLKIVPSAKIEFAELDLASLQSIATFAEKIVEDGSAVDLLINNAGVMSPPVRQTTRDGFELQIGVNYLGHFALTLRLLPMLLHRPGARVVNVTSLAHHQGRIAFEDLQSEVRYKPGIAYCQSKLAQAIFALELQRRCEARGYGLTSTSAHPGFATTKLFENGSGPRSAAALLSKYLAGPLLGQSPAKGALPLLYAATSPEVQGGGLYGPRGRFGMKGPPGPATYSARALDEVTAARLWDESEKLVGLRF